MNKENYILNIRFLAPNKTLHFQVISDKHFVSITFYNANGYLGCTTLVWFINVLSYSDVIDHRRMLVLCLNLITTLTNLKYINNSSSESTKLLMKVQKWIFAAFNVICFDFSTPNTRWWMFLYCTTTSFGRKVEYLSEMLCLTERICSQAD